jgi:hypothetical protein
MAKEVLITFNDVKDYINQNCSNVVNTIVDATEPFVMDYIKHPYGFAETDGVNDIGELIKEINLSFMMLASEPDGRVRRGLISQTIKREKTRWIEGHNAWFYGRFIGRVAYLLNEDKKK